MKKMSRVLTLAFSAFSFIFLTGFEGKIEVNEPLKFDTKKGLKELPEGEYGVTLKRVNSRKLQLEVHVEGRDNNPVADFKFPRGKSVPVNRGEFSLTSEESGQPYDIEGRIESEIEQTPERWTTEPCEHRVVERYCYYDRYGRPYCEYRERYVWGSRDVRYYDLITYRQLEADLFNPDQGTRAASLLTNEETSQRQYTQVGYCRR
jgi:hypothetical protein